MERTFKLIGRTTVFRVVKEYKAAGFIDSVIGHTLNGKFRTFARIADIEWLS